MASEFPAYLDVDYSDGTDESSADYPSIQHKLEEAIQVTRLGLEQYENPAIMWTGGKDSTLTLYFAKEVADRVDYDLPPGVFIDHFQHFDDLHHFVDHWAIEWNLDVIHAQNTDIGEYVDVRGLEPGDDIPIHELSDNNQHHVRNILEYEDETFPFLLDTYVENPLLKTVALNDALEAYDVDGILSGIHWDEQEARADETFFSPRHHPEIYPPHDCIQPFLQFDEASVWEAFWHFVVPDTVDDFLDDGYVPQGYDDLPNDLTHADLPVSPKYFAGFRSLGSEVSTTKADTDPAWLQDLDNTTERAGRAQDKEDLMERLRDLGYM